MHWNTCEIEPTQNKIYLVKCFDKMYYLANFSKRKKWHSFTHYIGHIDEDSEWGRRVQVRYWLDLDKIQKV